jgi:hypothetical protein
MAGDTLISVSVTDIVGAVKQNLVFLPSGTTLAQAQGFLTAFAPLVDALSQGVITHATVEFDLTLPSGLKSTAVAASTVRRGALWSFLNPTRYKWAAYLPAVDPSILSGTEVNPAAGGVAAYVAAYDTGITVSSVLIAPTNGSGEDLTALDHANETFRK